MFIPKQSMGTVVNIGKIPTLVQQLKKDGQKIVLVGGCFDILHSAHIEFLKKAKAQGDILVVLLESDERIRKLKGKNRPINTQKDRAVILSSLPFVSYVINLNNIQNDKDYEILVKLLKPDIIAITSGSPVYEWEKIYTKESGSKIVEVMDRKKDYSTTNIAQKIKL